MTERQSPYDTLRRCGVCGNLVAGIECPYCMTDNTMDRIASRITESIDGVWCYPCPVCGKPAPINSGPFCEACYANFGVAEWNKGVDEDDLPHHCARGHEMEHVRPGKWQCSMCEAIDAELAELRRHAPAIVDAMKEYRRLTKEELKAYMAALAWIERFVE